MAKTQETLSTEVGSGMYAVVIEYDPLNGSYGATA
jgi:hypothetical protein